ncbi:trimeric LpxA-like protein [Dipodascopsis uninucleata]
MFLGPPTSFISEHVKISDTDSENLIINVGNYAIINPRVSFKYLASVPDNEAVSSPNFQQAMIKPGIIDIGEYTIIADGCQLEASDSEKTLIGSYIYIDPAVKVEKGASIGDFCTLGAKCIIKRGAKIGKRCEIAAGTIIERNSIIPDYSIVYGSNALVKPNTFEASGVEQHMKDMKMHVDLLLRIMPSYNNRKADSGEKRTGH